MSDLNVQPKTVQDYRDIVKILKLKVMKQIKRIQQLQDKVKYYQSEDRKISQMEFTPIAQQQAQKDFDYSNLKNKSIVMYLFQKGAEKLGITLEGIFRYADINYKNEVDSDEFRNILSKMNLGLTLKQTSCLIFIFDQNCIGKITKQDYFNSLQAYQVNKQSKTKHYTQQCLLKFSEIFQDHRIQLNTFYDQMSKSQSVVDANVFQAFVKKKFGKLMIEREIIGAFNQIDFESQGFIEKGNFLYSVRAYMAKGKYTDDKIINQNRNSQTQQSFYKQTKKQKTPSKLNQSRVQKVIDSARITNNNNSFVQNAVQNNQPNLQQTLDYFNNRKLSLVSMYPHILHLNFNKLLTLFTFSNLLKSLDDNLQNSKICELFMLIDKNRKGSIHFLQLLEFFLSNQTDLDTTFKLFSKYFAINNLSSNRFFFINQITENSILNKKKFMEIFTNTFKIDSKLFDPLWKYFDKQGRDSVKAQTIIKQFSQYEQN